MKMTVLESLLAVFIVPIIGLVGYLIGYWILGPIVDEEKEREDELT